MTKLTHYADRSHYNDSPNLGLFRGGVQRPTMAMVEITNRCNMSCPVCFANSDTAQSDIKLEVVKSRINKLISIAGVIPLQISGGEPTLHPYLPEIIEFAKSSGFKNIELISNGIRISCEPDYLPLLKKAGLTAVYLQFDGLRKETHLAIRGRNMIEVREKSVQAIRKVKLCCTLAIAVARGINDLEINDIIRYGVKNIDTVRAINFQSATRFAGRYELAEDTSGYSLSELIALIERESCMDTGGFLTDVLGHSHCNAISLVYVMGDRLAPLFNYLSRDKLLAFLGNDKQRTIQDLFMGKERFVRKYLFDPKSWQLVIEAAAIFGDSPNLKSILQARHLLLFAKSFMERETLDLNRIDQCCYGIATDDGVYSFCSYNNLHRFNRRKDK